MTQDVRHEPSDTVAPSRTECPGVSQEPTGRLRGQNSECRRPGRTSPVKPRVGAPDPNLGPGAEPRRRAAPHQTNKGPRPIQGRSSLCRAPQAHSAAPNEQTTPPYIGTFILCRAPQARSAAPNEQTSPPQIGTFTYPIVLSIVDELERHGPVPIRLGLAQQ